MILFLSEYPQTEEQKKDGFFQRVIGIDSFFLEEERIYLKVSPFHFFKMRKINVDAHLTSIYCNFFLHFFFIVKLFKKASFVYIQSLFNVIYTFIFIKLIKKIYIFDLHGVVPEEFELYGKTFKKNILEVIEKNVYNRFSYVVAVTNQLKKHYQQKYPKATAEYIIYMILPKNLENYITEKEQNKSDIVHIIYSGNLQKWQNIDLMLQTIQNNLFSNFRYQILTGNLQEMEKKLKQYGLEKSELIRINSVSPEELSQYYKKSNYGFILRDDIAVNNVACPTKLVEYMNFGIIPITLSDNIGDFLEYGYERINYKDINKDLKPKKSLINIKIIKELYQSNNVSILSLFEKLRENNAN